MFLAKINYEDASEVSAIATSQGIEHQMTQEGNSDYVDFLFTTDFSRSAFIKLINENGFELYDEPKITKDIMIDAVIGGRSPKEVIDEALTNGMKNAFAKGKIKHKCPECGLAIPKYQGRYPNKCPECGESLNRDSKKVEAEQPDVEDLRKLFPKRNFKGWDVVKNKKDHVRFMKDGYEFNIESQGGYPSAYLKWPKSIGIKFIPSGADWGVKQFKDSYVVNKWSDASDWNEDKIVLKEVMDKLTRVSNEDIVSEIENFLNDGVAPTYYHDQRYISVHSDCCEIDPED